MRRSITMRYLRFLEAAAFHWADRLIELVRFLTRLAMPAGCDLHLYQRARNRHILYMQVTNCSYLAGFLVSRQQKRQVSHDKYENPVWIYRKSDSWQDNPYRTICPCSCLCPVKCAFVQLENRSLSLSLSVPVLYMAIATDYSILWRGRIRKRARICHTYVRNWLI